MPPRAGGMRPDVKTSWDEMSAPQTPIQRVAYIDACTRWFVEGAVDKLECFVERTTAPAYYRSKKTIVNSSSSSLSSSIPPSFSSAPPPPPPAPELHFHTLSELRALPRYACAFCDAEPTSTVLANPFAQRCVVLVCERCFQRKEE